MIKIRQLYETDLEGVGNDYCVGCFLNDRLVSYLLTINGKNDLEVCELAGLSDECDKTLVFKTCHIEDEFSGNGVEKRLCREICKNIQGRYKYILSSVSVDDTEFLKVLQKLGFMIYMEVDLKYIMRYDICQ